MSEDLDRCISILVLGAFSTGVFNTNALPRINIGADVWGGSSIMTGVWQTLGGKKKKKEEKDWSLANSGKKKSIYILIYTYGGTYKYVRWGGGLESGKL